MESRRNAQHLWGEDQTAISSNKNRDKLEITMSESEKTNSKCSLFGFVLQMTSHLAPCLHLPVTLFLQPALRSQCKPDEMHLTFQLVTLQLSRYKHWPRSSVERPRKFDKSPTILTNSAGTPPKACYADASQLGLATALPKTTRNCKVCGCRPVHHTNLKVHVTSRRHLT